MMCLFSNPVTSGSAEQMSCYDKSAEQLPYIATLGFQAIAGFKLKYLNSTPLHA